MTPGTPRADNFAMQSLITLAHDSVHMTFFIYWSDTDVLSFSFEAHWHGIAPVIQVFPILRGKKHKYTCVNPCIKCMEWSLSRWGPSGLEDSSSKANSVRWAVQQGEDSSATSFGYMRYMIRACSLQAPPPSVRRVVERSKPCRHFSVH